MPQSIDEFLNSQKSGNGGLQSIDEFLGATTPEQPQMNPAQKKQLIHDTFHPEQSPLFQQIQQEAEVRQSSPEIMDNANAQAIRDISLARPQTLGDKIFQDNKIARFISAPFKYLDQAAASGPYLGNKTDELGFRSLGERMAYQDPAATGNKTYDKAAQTVGNLAAPFVPLAGGPASGFSQIPIVQKLAGAAGGKLGGALGKVAESAIKGAAEGAPQNVAGELAINPNADAKDLAKAGLTGAALGGGLGAVGTATGAGLAKWAEGRSGTLSDYINRFIDRQKPVETPQPEPQPAEPPKQYKTPAGPQTANDVVKSIMEEVNQRATPPLESPKLLDKYLVQHLGADVPKAEIDALSYADKAELAGHVRDAINPDNLARQIAQERGYNWDQLRPVETKTVSPEPVTNEPVTLKTRETQPTQVPVMDETVQQLQPQKAVKRIETPPSVPNERGFISTLKESEKPPQGFKERLNAAYKPITNERTVQQANKRINKDIEEAASFVMGKSHFSAEKVTTAHRLIDEFNKQGNFQRAVDIAEKIAEEGTRAGQTVQAFSIYNRLTPEGVLVHAQRIAKKVNETLPVTAKEVTVTPDMAAQLTDLAATTRKMTGVKDMANDVVSILEKAKAGEKLSDAESQTLKKFVEESRQFVKEVEKKPKPPRPPQPPKDKRVRDNVISFLDAQEKAAKERLRAKGIRISSTPIDIWADYAIIGAAKMAKGTIKFSDWAEQMVKEVGEEIRPHLENLYEKAKETFDLSAKKVTKSTISQAERITEKVIKNKQLAGDEADALRALAEKVSGLSGEAKRLASQDLQVVLQTLEKPGILKKISTAQTIGQLLNPKTHVRNAIGNELFYRLERLQKLITAPIDWGRVKLFGGERSVTFRTYNQGKYWENWMKGWKAGWRGVGVDGLQTQFDLGPPAFSAKWNPLTYLEKVLGASLRSFDTAAYMRAVNNTIGEMATLRAINEGLTGEARAAAIQKYIREVDDHVLKIADQYGKYVTFQDNNVISKGLSGLKRGLNFGKDFGVGDIVIKYPKTPGALLMRALEYSPGGFLRSAYIAAKPFLRRGSDPNTAEAMQALSRAIMGTAGLSGLGWFLYDKGILTGSASKDKDIRDLQKSAGQGQYQVNLSALKRWVLSGFNPDEAKLKEGDQLYTYDWMQPVSVAVSMGANVGQNMQEKTGLGKGALNLAGAAYNTLEGGLNTLVEQSVLQGVRNAVQGYPGQSVMDKVTDILSDVPASFVPTAFNQVKQLTDNARRETYDPSKTQQSLNRAQAKIPGLAGKLPQQFDTLGRPKETFQNNSAFNVLFNPGFESKYELSPEARAVVNLISDTGDESLAPRVPGKSIMVKGPNGNVSQKLTTEQFARLQELQGTYTREAISRIPPNISQDAKAKRMKAILSDAGDKARKELKREIGVK